MDKIEQICDLIEDFICEKGSVSEENIEALTYRIFDELDICEKCGAKLRR